jgi:hypothetical protein
LACKIVIEFNKQKNTTKSQKYFALSKNKANNSNKTPCTLTIIAILVSYYSPLLNTFSIRKILQCLKLFSNMHITIDKWIVSLLWSFDLIKAEVEKHVSSSTLLIIYNMASSTKFTYIGELKTNIWNLVTRHHVQVKKWMSKGGTIQDVGFDFIMSLNMPCWQSISVVFRTSCTLISCSFTLCVLP